MADAHRSDKSMPPLGDGTHGKKPYKKPEFRVERVFETTALACGKVSSTQAQCKTNKKVS